MALYRIQRKFFPTESFVIDFDFDSKKLHVLDVAELANLKEHEVLAEIDATDDEERGKMFKDIIFAFHSIKVRSDAEVFANELLSMTANLRSRFEFQVLLLQATDVAHSVWVDRTGDVPVVNVDNAPSFYRTEWRSYSPAFTNLVCYLDNYRKLSEVYNNYNVVPDDDEMHRDYRSNIVSHPEYRMSPDEAANCIKQLFAKDHWIHRWIKDHPPVKTSLIKS